MAQGCHQPAPPCRSVGGQGPFMFIWKLVLPHHSKKEAKREGKARKRETERERRARVARAREARERKCLVSVPWSLVAAFPFLNRKSQAPCPSESLNQSLPKYQIASTLSP